jgi:endoglucanase
MRKKSRYLIILIFFNFTSCVEARKAPTQPEKVEFKMGVHFNQWLESASVNQIYFEKYSKVDFVNFKKLGGNILRLPINFPAMNSGSPKYEIDTVLFNYLDKAISWAKEMNIYIIIDNHAFNLDGGNYNDTQLTRIWDQISHKYKDESDLIMYEICNEPHDISDYVWGKIQQNAINVIRKNDSKHTIIVSPSGWSSFRNLKNLPVYSDSNLIYDFHFYDPMVFTHQCASFITPQTINLKNVPFPYDPTRMPIFPDDLKGTWFETSFNNYSTEGQVESLKKLIDIAIEFRDTRKVRIYCGELGVHIPGASPIDRVFWYETVCSYLNQNNIPFTIWDYKDVFGVFNISTANPNRRWFPDDLNMPLIKAIGFNDPTIKE